MLERYSVTISDIISAGDTNSPAYEASRLASPRRISTGGIDSLPVYSLAIAEMITISVEEKEELASTIGVINVVAQPIRKVETAIFWGQSSPEPGVSEGFTIFDIQENISDDVLQYGLMFWRCV